MDAGEGRHLTTYFIGWCLLQFNSVYRAWQVQRKHDAPVTEAVEFDVDRHDRGGLGDPARAVVALDAARRVLDTAVGSSRRSSTRRQTATILPLLAAGLSQAEVATVLGTTERAVEGHLARLRKRLPQEDDG
jgi:DNA-binding CsgD family transcriptional regulator